MKRQLIGWLWRHRRAQLLAFKGIKNHTLLHESEFLDLFMDIYVKKMAEASIRDLYNLYTCVRQTASIPGEIAEFGVYKGGSAKVIGAAKGGKALHLFDTFSGMPATDTTIDRHRQGDFADTSLATVTGYLATCKNVFFHPGLFPHSAQQNSCENLQFSFVHIDVDIYTSTLAGLEFFYPRLHCGGALLIHDYRAQSCPGVQRAVSEFFADKAETIIPLWDTQCVLFKK